MKAHSSAPCRQRRFTSGMAFLLIAVASPGCTTIENLPTSQILMANGNGEMVDPGPNWCGWHTNFWGQSVFDENEQSAHLDRVIADLLKKTDGRAPRRIMLYIHGGLPTDIGNLETAADTAGRMASEKAAGDRYHPIFVVWKSSLWANLRDHLFMVRQGKYEPWWGPILSPFYIVEAAVHGIIRMPFVVVREIRDVVFPDRERAKRRIAKIREGHPSWTGVSSFDLHGGHDVRGEWQKFLGGTTFLLLLPARQALTPILDGFGSRAWGNLLRNTRLLFDQQQDFKNATRRPTTGALSRLLDRLQTELHDEDWQLTIVGHSMGTIVANRILRRYPDLPIENIVYMAAACSVGDFLDSTLGHLHHEQHERDESGSNKPLPHVYSLTLQDRAETEEQFSDWFDVVLRGSLLVWLDAFLSDPKTLIDRTAGRMTNLVPALHLVPPEFRGQYHIKQFDYGWDAWAKHPQKHGEFDDFEFWKRAYWTPKNFSGYERIGR